MLRLGVALIVLTVAACKADAGVQSSLTTVTLTPCRAAAPEVQIQERGARGIPTLVLDPRLVEVARFRARTTKAEQRLEHNLTDGTPVFAVLLRRSGYKYRAAAENLARNDFDDDDAGATAVEGFLESSGATAVEGFLDSPAHRDAMLGARLRL